MPKTLIFAKDDNHAEEVVTTVREVFGKGNVPSYFAARSPMMCAISYGQVAEYQSGTESLIYLGTTVERLAELKRDGALRSQRSAARRPRRPPSPGLSGL